MIEPMVDGDSRFITILKLAFLILLFAAAIALAPLCVICRPLDNLIWGKGRNGR